MAKKKFYYRNKSRSAAKAQLNDRIGETAKYTPEQLAMTLDALALSDAAKKLLSGSGIATAADLVIRSEKDMYKVQGLNKRVLAEIKDSLGKNGMSLYPLADEGGSGDEAKTQAAKQLAKAKQQSEKNADNATATALDKQKTDRSKSKQEKKSEERSSKFGLADRHEQDKTPPVREQRSSRQEKALTEPLAMEQWRKVIKGGKWGFSDGFKIVIPPMYDEVFSFRDGLASVEIDGKCGYIDSQNNVVVPLEYDLAMSFSEGLAMVAKGEKCGYINKQNEVVIDFLYDAASPFEGGEAKVKKDGKWATLTPDGKLTWI